MSKEGIKFDLVERSDKFGENILSLLITIKRDDLNRSMIVQLSRSATSIGANYAEANCAESKKDFIHKMSIANKELGETKHWLRMLSILSPNNINSLRKLWKEANELNKIFSSIIYNTKINIKNS